MLNKKTYIKDLRSKFGTLVLSQKDIEIKNRQVNLQIGRSYIEFSLSKDNLKAKREYFLNYKNKNIFKIIRIQTTKFSLNTSLSNSSGEEKLFNSSGDNKKYFSK